MLCQSSVVTMSRCDLRRFMSFQFDQGGVYPPSLAAEFLGISRQALHVIAQQGRLKYVVVAGRRYYGLKSVTDHRWYYAKAYGGGRL